jgi:hypothetical protein
MRSPIQREAQQVERTAENLYWRQLGSAAVALAKVDRDLGNLETCASELHYAG